MVLCVKGSPGQGINQEARRQWQFSLPTMWAIEIELMRLGLVAWTLMSWAISSLYFPVFILTWSPFYQLINNQHNRLEYYIKVMAWSQIISVIVGGKGKPDKKFHYFYFSSQLLSRKLFLVETVLKTQLTCSCMWQQKLGRNSSWNKTFFPLESKWKARANLSLQTNFRWLFVLVLGWQST